MGPLCSFGKSCLYCEVGALPGLGAYLQPSPQIRNGPNSWASNLTGLSLSPKGRPSAPHRLPQTSPREDSRRTHNSSRAHAVVPWDNSLLPSCSMVCGQGPGASGGGWEIFFWCQPTKWTLMSLAGPGEGGSYLLTCHVGVLPDQAFLIWCSHWTPIPHTL